jgi:transglutaminase-like putative cysteine protease
VSVPPVRGAPRHDEVVAGDSHAQREAGRSASAGPRADTSDPTLSVGAARGIAFVALCGFASLQWMQMLEPAAPGRAGYALLTASGAMFALLLAGRLRNPRLRLAVAVLVAVAAAAFALLSGGIADELLRPARWGELAAGIGRGISALPGARVPYRGLDEWTRAVIALGGTALATAAALIAFWPRRNGLGLHLVALVLLVTLYVVPAVALDRGSELLSGALLALLAIAYLRLERLRIGDAQAAGLLAVGVVILGLAVAPALDSGQPWFDYETWALSNASSRSTAFNWEHTYGPLDWPRDGRELLRVKAKRPAYWKALNLDDFDGLHWVHDESAANLDGCGSAGYYPENRGRWLQTISVSVRNLRTPTFVTAGVACAVDSPRISKIPLGDGTYSAETRALRRGDAYQAKVYTPAPTERERRTSGDFTPSGMTRFTEIELPDMVPTGNALGTRVQFPLFGTIGEPTSTPVAATPATVPQPAQKLLENSRYNRTWRLAQRLKRSAKSPEDYVEAVMSYLKGAEFSYTESPPVSAENLDGFLFDAKTGYCQQYSGAMALLLRMGGVPARVASGFTSGSYDRGTKEYVVRDLDAHSWVEVWYSGIGWVTWDPTPAVAPARSQPDESAQSGSLAARGAPDLGGDVRTGGTRGLAAIERDTPWGWIAAGAVALVALIVLSVWLFRRHRRFAAAGWGPVSELERALRRTRRASGPAATLRQVEAAFVHTPAAAGYVRALREQRFGGRSVAPDGAGRRAVRSELGRGQGVRGRLRAWWALPPRLH